MSAATSGSSDRRNPDIAEPVIGRAFARPVGSSGLRLLNPTPLGLSNLLSSPACVDRNTDCRQRVAQGRASVSVSRQMLNGNDLLRFALSLVEVQRTVADPPDSRCALQSILPTIVVISAAENARSVSVRTLPSAPRLKLSDMTDDSSDASMMVTMSYRPWVQRISFTVTPKVFAVSLKAPARFGESLALRMPCSVNFVSTT